MELYKVPNRTWVKIKDTDEIIHLYHIDGMYSYCKTVDGELCHIKAWTDVDVVDPPLDNYQKM